MKRLQSITFSCFAFSFLFISCEKGEQKEGTKLVQRSEKLATFFEDQHQLNLSLHPEERTYLGQKVDYDKWDDISEAFLQKENLLKEEALRYMKDSIAFDDLNANDQLNYTLFQNKLKNQIKGFQYRDYFYMVHQMRGVHSKIPSFLINMHRIDSIKDAESYIKRLEAAPKLLAQLEARLENSFAKGIMPPKFVFPKVIESCENLFKGMPFDSSERQSTLLADFTSKLASLEIPEDQKKEVIDSAQKVLQNEFAQAYQSLISFLKKWESKASEDAGVWKFPKGEAFYNYCLQYTTTTNMTSKEIHDIGLKEVARIHEEMRVIMKKVGYKGTLQEFFVFMKEDPQFYYPATKEGKAAYLAEAVAIIDSMKVQLDAIFITKPKADIIVKAVEPFREKAAGKAFYQSPALDGSRPGTYYANLYDMASMPNYQMEALAYHEGIPGHHMQLSIAQELENVPMFRKLSGYTVYAEGWGLYSEFIPKEMGFYQDPYSDFGRLAMELWRACRLVVDTGIHDMKWTREEGIAYYVSNTPNAELDAIKMVERHIVMPGQATAYKIGMLKILELRAKAKKALSEKFDIRQFHEVILTNGALPLNVLEDKVDQWIASVI